MLIANIFSTYSIPVPNPTQYLRGKKKESHKPEATCSVFHSNNFLLVQSIQVELHKTPSERSSRCKSHVILDCRSILTHNRPTLFLQ